MKEIITLDKANQPYGYPQLDGSGNLIITGSVEITGSLKQNGYEVKPYKVYTALLTQSGNSNIDTIDSGNTVIGVTYQIDASVTGDDFRDIGGPLITYDNEFIDYYFVATDTTPDNWTNGTVLRFDTGAPTVIVLENTIGNIWFTYVEVGSYFVKSNGLFTDKTYLNMQAFLYGPDEDRRIGISVGDVNTIQIITTFGTVAEDGNLFNTSMEIRVYN